MSDGQFVILIVVLISIAYEICKRLDKKPEAPKTPNHPRDCACYTCSGQVPPWAR